MPKDSGTVEWGKSHGCLLSGRDFSSLHLPRKLQALAGYTQSSSPCLQGWFILFYFFSYTQAAGTRTSATNKFFFFFHSMKKSRGMPANLACNVAVLKRIEGEKFGLI